MQSGPTTPFWFRLNVPLINMLSFFSTILADLPAGKAITFTEIDYLINRVATFVLLTSVTLAVIFIVRAGVTWMYAGANSSKVDEARGQLKSAIVGAFVVLAAGVIINTIAAVVTREFFCQLSVLGVCLIP